MVILKERVSMNTDQARQKKFKIKSGLVKLVLLVNTGRFDLINPNSKIFGRIISALQNMSQ